MAHGNIPKDPYENLARVESILARYKRDLARTLEQLETTKGKLAEHRKIMLAANASEDDKHQYEVQTRKFMFDIKFYSKGVGKLKGQISWATERQIPFLKSEIELLEEGKNKEAAL